MRVNSDFVYMIYDFKDSEVCIAQFDNKQEAANYLNIDKECLSSAISKENLIKRKYLIKRVNTKEDKIYE